VSAPTVVYVSDGRARLLRLDDDGAVELARVDVSGMREADVLTLMLNIAQSFNGTGVRAPRTGRADGGDAPGPRGIMSSMPAKRPGVRAPAPAKRTQRAPTARRPLPETVLMMRRYITAHPEGVTRAELAKAVGRVGGTNTALFAELEASHDVRTERGATVTAPIRYYPTDEAKGGAA